MNLEEEKLWEWYVDFHKYCTPIIWQLNYLGPPTWGRGGILGPKGPITCGG